MCLSGSCCAQRCALWHTKRIADAKQTVASGWSTHADEARRGFTDLNAVMRWLSHRDKKLWDVCRARTELEQIRALCNTDVFGWCCENVPFLFNVPRWHLDFSFTPMAYWKKDTNSIKGGGCVSIVMWWGCLRGVSKPIVFRCKSVFALSRNCAQVSMSLVYANTLVTS